MTHHYEGEDLILRKIRVGPMENNTYVLECPATHEALLVDGCFEADRIIEASAGADIKGIVQTHGHMDHVQALGDLKERLGVPLYAHPADDYPVEIEKELSDGDVVGFGNREVKVLHTPGHSPGSVCFVHDKHLISGDTLFPGGPGNTWGDADLFAEIIRSVRRLFELADETVVYPGHGDDTSIGKERPQLQEWIDRGW